MTFYPVSFHTALDFEDKLSRLHDAFRYVNNYIKCFRQTSISLLFYNYDLLFQPIAALVCRTDEVLYHPGASTAGSGNSGNTHQSTADGDSGSFFKSAVTGFNRFDVVLCCLYDVMMCVSIYNTYCVCIYFKYIIAVFSPRATREQCSKPLLPLSTCVYPDSIITLPLPLPPITPTLPPLRPYRWRLRDVAMAALVVQVVVAAV